MYHRFLPLLGAVVLAGTATAEVSSASAESSATTGEFRRASLVERPPFARVEQAARSGSGGPLELRGFFGSGDTLEVSLSRPSTKESLWVRVGDNTSKWIVESADVDAGTAEVRFDGMQLHLTLAKPELLPEGASPIPSAAPAAPAEDKAAQQRVAMSREGREAMSKARREIFEAARAERPEYFDGRTLTNEQQAARSEYMASLNDKVRSAVAAISPADAERMGGGPSVQGNPGGSPGGTVVNSGGGNAGQNNRGGQRPQRGGNN